MPAGIAECRFYERSIYHLDGPGRCGISTRFLKSRSLTRFQWVPGAGNEGYAKWVWVYQKIQKAGKALELRITLDELPLVFET